MLMRSPGYALSWEYWRRGVWWLVPACVALVVGLLAPAYIVLTDSPGVRMALSVTAFASTWWVAIVFAAVSRTTLRRLYTLPLSTQSLVNWRLTNGVFAVLVTYWLTAVTINRLFHGDWPLLVPSWWAVVLYVVFQTIVWSMDKGRGILLIPAVALGLLALFSISRQCFERLVANGADGISLAWAALAFDLACPFVVAVCFYLAALYLVGRDRRGESRSRAWLNPPWWTQRKGAPVWHAGVEGGATIAHRFRSPHSAQLWLEWRSKGRYFPLSVAALLSIVWISSFFTRADAASMSEAFAGLTSTILLFAPLVGVFLGHRSERFDMKSFLATRPLSDGELAASVLGNAALALGSGATIWSVGVLSTLAVCDVPAVFDGLALLANWREVLMLFLHACVWIGLAWTLIGLGLSAGLARSWFIPVVGGGAGVFLVFSFWILHASRGYPIQTLLFIAMGACCLGGTAIVFTVAVRRRLIGSRTLLGCFGGYLGLLALGYFTWGVENTPLTGHVLLIGLCALPLAPLAAAPLALSWNRHR